MILIAKFLVPKGYLGITLFPFIVLKQEGLKQDKILVNHEKIHLRQQLEILVLPFFIWYAVEFLLRLIQYRHWQVAYRNISFEREAYQYEANYNYLKNRPFWGFLRYLVKR